MAGLVKAKKYDWKDSNLALFGSDLEKNVRRYIMHSRTAAVLHKHFKIDSGNLKTTKLLSIGQESFGGDRAGMERGRKESWSADMAHCQV